MARTTIPFRDEPETTARFLMVLIAITTCGRLWLAHRYFGFHSGDDVELLQAAFMRAVGLVYVPWEIRNLFVSDVLIVPVVSLASALGVESARSLCWIATFPFVVLASINTLLVYQLGQRWFGELPTALLAATLYAFHWLPLGYGSTVYPRTASTTCILLAALLLTARPKTIPSAAAAGALMGIVFAVRYSEVIFLAPMMIAIAVRRKPAIERFRHAAAFAAGFVAMSLLTVGLYEFLTSGRPFANLIAFAKFTLIERQSSSLQKIQPWYWYFLRLPKWLPLTVIPLFFWPKGPRRLGPSAIFIAVPLLVLSAVHHKELRYLQGLIPFVSLATAQAAWRWWQSGRRHAVVILLVLGLAFGVSWPGFLRKKSMAAVLAAESLSRRPGLTKVALSQSWAYGGRMFLPRGTKTRNLPVHPTPTDLDAADSGWIGLYQDVVQTAPDIQSWLDDHGYEHFASFESARSRRVLVFNHAEHSESRPSPQSK